MSTPAKSRRNKKSGPRESKNREASTTWDAEGEPTEKVSTVSSGAFPVVGVGASAGGLAAVTELLKRLPDQTGAAFVIIQHLDPRHGSLTADILSRVSSMPVDEVRNGMRLQPNHVYVIPPNSNMRLVRGILKLSPRTEIRGQHLPIDLFFKSLAEDRMDRAIGVVLSGIASDGTMGVQAIKAEGGFTFAQDPTSAQYDGMPRSAILSGAVDIVETPERMAGEIAKMATLFSTRPANRVIIEPHVTPHAPNGNLRRIFAAIRKATRVDFTHYKHSTVQRRIARRLFLLKIEDLRTYADYVESHPEEAKTAFADILIHVTGFFRDPDVYEKLKTRILPKYMENWDPAYPFRVWVAGCSTGEEAYSIAIAFYEYLDKAKVRPALQIFASDVSDHSLQRARTAIYPESIARDVSRVRLKRYFEKLEGGGYRIAKWIRDTCLFSRHDVTADPPFAKIDIISCRNVLIYFASELQKRVVPILHYSLNPGGILWLGRSETISGFGDLFALENKANKFYFKKPVVSAVRFYYPVARMPDMLEARRAARSPATLHEVQAEADRAAIQQYVPPGVVINDSAEILHVRGRPAPYLALGPGQASLNFFKLVHPEILSDLRYLIRSARTDGRAASREGMVLQTKGERRTFGVRVVPIRVARPSKEHYFAIFFEEGSARAEPAPPVFESGEKKSKKRTGPQQTFDEQRYQEGLIEEYETTQEELIASNEELQSTNEELQSTNEELETAKEELQSANEEMTTINDELQTRNTEMTQLTNDLTNLLASVDIPIVMVGSDARIRRFTPKAGQMLKLIPADVGRSIGDIKPTLQTLDLEDIVSDVMMSLSLKEFETQDKQGAWYRLQVRPYRTTDNRIDGAVIAVTDITALKRAAEVLTIARDDAKRILDTMPTPVLVISSDYRVQSTNESFLNMFRVGREETEGSLLSELCDGRWNLPSLLAALDSVLKEGVPLRDFELEREFPRIGFKYMVLHATATRFTGAGTNTALLAIEDITARKQAAEALRETEERYRHLLENANDGILIVTQDQTIGFANPRIEAMFGYASGELINQKYEVLIPEQHRGVPGSHHAPFPGDPERRDVVRALDLVGRHKDGRIFPVEISLSPMRTDSSTMTTAIIRDISERKKMEAERQDLLLRETSARREAERASQSKDEFLATLSHELRTPLTTILSWAQVLRLGKIDVQKTTQALTLIERSAKDQAQLIDDLLDVSRIQAGKVSLDLRELVAGDSVVAAVESVRNLADDKSITIKTEFDPLGCLVLADSGRLQQVFRNLFTNAIKFTPRGGKITVRLKHKKDPELLEIQVQDTGKGIKPEFLPHLFARFSQEDSSPKRLFSGLGLGLSIVRNLVEMHGGSVTAASPGEGKGAIFTVTLPCTRTRPAEVTRGVVGRQTSAGNKPAKLTGIRVLIIDDLDETRRAFSVMLQSCGALTKTAASAKAGLAALAQFKPNLVLCDIAMPREDGLSFIRKVRELKPGRGRKVLAVAVTAYAGTDNVRQALDAGFDAHLAKPVGVVDLSRVIKKLTGRRKK
jgi:two-component system, chemotaxis family, CheB/CheR fusion protein